MSVVAVALAAWHTEVSATFSKWTWIVVVACFSLGLFVLRKSLIDPNSQASLPLFFTAATPIAATGDARTLYHYHLSLEPPQAKSPAKDSLKSLTMGHFRGKLIYPVNAFFQTEPSLRPFLFLRQIGPQPIKTNPVAIYEVKSPIYVFDPQFSPDGKNVLFKMGFCCVDKGDRFSPLAWNTQNHRAYLLIQSTLAAPLFSWSPDSRCITYIYGGNHEGQEEERGFGPAPVRLLIYDLKSGQSHRVAQNPAVIYNAWTRQGTILYIS